MANESWRSGCLDNPAMQCLTPHSVGRQRGFTLIELLIAVVVIGILSAIAFPNFMDYIRKGRRSEAFSALSGVQQAQERWRANNALYAGNLTAAPPTGLGLAATTAGSHYTIAISSATATGYDVTATAMSSSTQAGDRDCAKLGVRMAAGNLTYAGTSSSGTLAYAATNKCWSR
jgi:type IV pilus assembly protein PilE